jgi:uncharacterized coiled-coil protein SlyX
MYEWMKILVPLVVTLLVTILISVWQSRKSAASEACRIRAEREKTRLVRDKLEENHEQRLRSLENSRSADSAKIDTLSDTVTKGRVENAESFGKIFEALKWLKETDK